MPRQYSLPLGASKPTLPPSSIVSDHPLLYIMPKSPPKPSTTTIEIGTHPSLLHYEISPPKRRMLAIGTHPLLENLQVSPKPQRSTQLTIGDHPLLHLAPEPKAVCFEIAPPMFGPLVRTPPRKTDISDILAPPMTTEQLLAHRRPSGKKKPRQGSMPKRASKGHKTPTEPRSHISRQAILEDQADFGDPFTSFGGFDDDLNDRDADSDDEHSDGDEQDVDTWAADPLDWSTDTDVLLSLRMSIVPRYWEYIKMGIRHSYLRVTKRCFIIQDWNVKDDRLQLNQWRHVFKMVDTDGIERSSCNCRNNTGVDCLHILALQQNEGDLGEPECDKEEPSVVLICANYHLYQYVFSVHKSSGSTRHHSHKRTIVTCGFDGFFHCKSCPRDCRHITAARGLLPQLEVEGIVERNRSQRTTDLTQPVSHLPIPVPIWAHIPDDKLPPIDIPGQLPSVFLFDETVRCSCGNTKPSAFRESHKFIIFGLSAAQVHQIETSPCSECRETRTNTRASLGPDLGRYGVFNWNNRIGFSHQLLNRYCIQFRRQETPFDAFYETTVDTYLESGSPENLCGQKTFVSAWFAFVRLQEIGSSMRCSICGPDPEIVIVDGVSIGFASQRIRGLKPPTKRLAGRVRVTPGSFRGTCFVGTRSAQTTILKALDVSDPDTRCAELRSHLEKLQTDDEPNAKVFKDCIEEYCSLEEDRGDKYSARYRQLLLQVFSSDFVLQIIRPPAIDLLKEYSRGEFEPNPRLAALCPAFGMLFLNMDIDLQTKKLQDSPNLRRLASALADRARNVYDHLVESRVMIDEGNDEAVDEQNSDDGTVNDWSVTGCYYGKPYVRYRPFYEGRDEETVDDAAGKEVGSSCKKYFSTYSKDKLTGGLLAFWCPHLVCLGYHAIPKAEGRNDVFSGLYCFFEKAPRIVIYDFACQLSTYCMSREPEFFKDTIFVIDEMHAQGHVGCSQASYVSNLMLQSAMAQTLNSSAAECSNKGLNRIRKSVSYMNESHANMYTYVFLSLWNRHRERGRQQQVEKDVTRFRGV